MRNFYLKGRLTLSMIKQTRKIYMNEELKIDLEDLIMAFEDHSEFFDYYLDLRNGKVIHLLREYSDEGSYEEPVDLDGYSYEMVEGDPDRFRYIDSIQSYESFKIMEEFVITVVNVVIKNRLISALERRKPFRNFKDELHHLPEVSEKWFEFHDDAMEKISRDWLYGNDVEAELVRRHPGSGGGE